MSPTSGSDPSCCWCCVRKASCRPAPSCALPTGLLKHAPVLLQASSRHCCSRHFLVPLLDATIPQAQSPPGKSSVTGHAVQGGLAGAAKASPVCWMSFCPAHEMSPIIVSISMRGPVVSTAMVCCIADRRHCLPLPGRQDRRCPALTAPHHPHSLLPALQALPSALHQAVQPSKRGQQPFCDAVLPLHAS